MIKKLELKQYNGGICIFPFFINKFFIFHVLCRFLFSISSRDSFSSVAVVGAADGAAEVL
jgi:hypothetical protein